jgi:hypothetical protein
MMLENGEGVFHENVRPGQKTPSNIKHQTSNIKQDNNSPVCESQDVPYACIIRRIDSIQATLARMATILNSEPEQKVQS